MPAAHSLRSVFLRNRATRPGLAASGGGEREDREAVVAELTHIQLPVPAEDHQSRPVELLDDWPPIPELADETQARVEHEDRTARAIGDQGVSIGRGQDRADDAEASGARSRLPPRIRGAVRLEPESPESRWNRIENGALIIDVETAQLGAFSRLVVLGKRRQKVDVTPVRPLEIGCHDEQGRGAREHERILADREAVRCESGKLAREPMDLE